MTRMIARAYLAADALARRRGPRSHASGPAHVTELPLEEALAHADAVALGRGG